MFKKLTNLIKSNKHHLANMSLVIVLLFLLFLPTYAEAGAISAISKILCLANPAACAGQKLGEFGVNMVFGDGIAGTIGDWILQQFAWIGSIFTGIASFSLWLVANLLDLSVHISISQIHNWFSNEGVVTAWRLMRDLANMTFIFVLLYIAIGTVFDLQGVGGNAQKLIVNVIIVALLVNFSGFLTRVVIDASNVVASEFYNAMSPTGVFNIGSELAGKLNLVSFTDEPRMGAIDPKLSLMTVLTSTLLSIFTIFIASFTFLVASFLFLIRTFQLLFLYIVSPLAIASYAIPKFNYFDKWFKKLISQSLVAPGFIIPIYVVFILLGPGMESLMTDQGVGGRIVGNLGTTLMTYILIIGLLLLSLKIARDVGAAGIGAATAISGGSMALAAKYGAKYGGKYAGKLGAKASTWAQGVGEQRQRAVEYGAWSPGRLARAGAATVRGVEATTAGAKAAAKKFKESELAKTTAGKKVTSFIENPLLGTADIITAGAEAAGLGRIAIMGSTAQERAEGKKKEKEEKEEAKKKELKNKSDQLGIAAKAGNWDEVDKILDNDIQAKDIDKIDKKVLLSIAKRLSHSHLNSLQNKLKDLEFTPAELDKIKSDIVGDQSSRGYAFMYTGPGREKWGTPTPAAPPAAATPPPIPATVPTEQEMENLY